MFLHYTVDEPVWLAVMQTAAMLAFITAVKGTRIIMYISYLLQWLSLYPMLMYLWLDYRWYCQV